MPVPRISPPPLVRGLFLWNKLAPRARAAVPRAVGRMLAPTDFFISTHHGPLVKVDYANLDFYAEVYNHNGLWDEMMILAPRLLRADDVFYDIGANAGVVALDAAVKVSRDLQVYAFEPQPQFAAPALASATANGLTRFNWLECLLGATEGEATLHLTSHAIHASMIPREGGSTPLTRPIHRLDGLVASGQIAPPDVIKIDVEGYELSVFAGATDTFKAKQPVILFEADDNLIRFGKTVADVFAALSALAPYRFWRIAKDGSVAPATAPFESGCFLAMTAKDEARLG